MDGVNKKIEESSSAYKALYIAFLAMLLALASMLSNDAARIALNAHIEASNQFSYFQAKNIRMNIYELAVEQMNVQTEKGQAVEEVINKFKNKAATYRNEKKEILKMAREHVEQRAKAREQGRYYDYAIALFQISIVIASASIVAPGGILMLVSLISASGAIAFMVNGYTLYYHLPENLLTLLPGWDEIQREILKYIS